MPPKKSRPSGGLLASVLAALLFNRAVLGGRARWVGLRDVAEPAA